LIEVPLRPSDAKSVSVLVIVRKRHKNLRGRMFYRGVAMGQIDRTHERSSAAGQVLIVEDNFLVGADMQAVLEQAGYEVLGPAATVAAALAFIKLARPDAAVLDLNLASEKSHAVIDELAARNIPVVITSGCAAADLPEKYRHHPLLAKPYLPRELVRRVAQAMGSSRPPSADAAGGSQSLRQQ